MAESQRKSKRATLYGALAQPTRGFIKERLMQCERERGVLRAYNKKATRLLRCFTDKVPNSGSRLHKLEVKLKVKLGLKLGAEF
jgi:hypothetical protein